MAQKNVGNATTKLNISWERRNREGIDCKYSQYWHIVVCPHTHNDVSAKEIRIATLSITKKNIFHP